MNYMFDTIKVLDDTNIFMEYGTVKSSTCKPAKKKASAKKKMTSSDENKQHFPDGFDVRKPLPEFGISRLQILDEHGHVNTDLEPDLSDSDLIGLFQSMLVGRAVDQRMLKLQRQGRLGTFPPCSGQEATGCAPVLAMRETDWHVGSYRELGGRIMRGEPLENAMLYYNGYEEGSTFEGGERTLPISVIIGSQTLHAVGIAYAMRLQGETDTCVICHFGDGASSQGDVHEAMNFASVWKVPVVFICVNNQWAISVPYEKQSNSRTLAQRAIAYDMPGIQIDGNDPLAVYQATKDALDRGRAGDGPTFIEALTYRTIMHTTADDPTRYQPSEMVDSWKERDALIRFETYLRNKNLWDDANSVAYEAEVKHLVEEAVARFEGRTDFKVDAPFDNVFETAHPGLAAQRTAFQDNIKRGASQ